MGFRAGEFAGRLRHTLAPCIESVDNRLSGVSAAVSMPAKSLDSRLGVSAAATRLSESVTAQSIRKQAVCFLDARLGLNEHASDFMRGFRSGARSDMDEVIPAV